MKIVNAFPIVVSHSLGQNSISSFWSFVTVANQWQHPIGYPADCTEIFPTDSFNRCLFEDLSDLRQAQPYTVQLSGGQPIFQPCIARLSYNIELTQL